MNTAACTPGLIAVLATLALGSAPARAQDKATASSPHTLTGNVNLVSEYRYRGIAQTNGKPAVQGGFDYAHASGFYVGTWASNVSWLSDAGGGAVSNSLEWDFYGGYKGTVGDFGYDAGVLQYYYPGRYPRTGYTKPHTTELYVAGSWKMLTLKYSHSVTDTFGFPDSKNSGYLDLTGNFDVGAGFTLVAHAGHQRIAVSGEFARTRSDCSYTDWKLGVTREVVGLTVGLAYVDTNARGNTGQCYRSPQPFNRDLGKPTAVLSVGKTF